MRALTVAAVTTTRVITAAPGTTFRELVAALRAEEVSALPVVDPGGHPIGVVSEADLLAKREFHGGTDEKPRTGRESRERWSAHRVDRLQPLNRKRGNRRCGNLP